MGPEYFAKPKPQTRQQPLTPAHHGQQPVRIVTAAQPEEPSDEWTGSAVGGRPNVVNDRKLRPKKKDEPPPRSFTAQPGWRKPVTEADIASAISFTPAKTATGLGLPSHINLWGCLLFAAWIASFAAYIGIRAAKTIDRHFSIFAYQVVVLIFEAVGGLVTGQQGLALVSCLNSARTLKEQQEADVHELVASGKSKPNMVPPPDLPYPLPATSSAAEDTTQPAATGIAGGRNTSAMSVVPPRHATARMTQGSSALASIMARLTGGAPTRSSATADNSDAETIRGSLDIRSNTGSTATGDHKASGSRGVMTHLAGQRQADAAEEDAVSPLKQFGGMLPKVEQPDEEGTASAPPTQPPAQVETLAAPSMQPLPQQQQEGADAAAVQPVEENVVQRLPSRTRRLTPFPHDPLTPADSHAAGAAAADAAADEHVPSGRPRASSAADDPFSTSHRLPAAAPAAGTEMSAYAADKSADAEAGSAAAVSGGFGASDQQPVPGEAAATAEDAAAVLPATPGAAPPPTLPFYRDQADAPALAGAIAHVQTSKRQEKPPAAHHIQVLVWAPPEVHLGALEATLRHLTAATLPQGATRAIYVVDSYRSEERQLSIAEQGYEGVSYIPTLRQGAAADDLGKAACLNRALRRLYPNNDTPISGSDLVAVFDGSQACEKPFFEAALAALQSPAVAVAAAAPSYARVKPAADIFDLTQRSQQLRVRGQSSLGLTWSWDSGLVVRAAALRAAGWLPEHSDAPGAALGSALRGLGLGSAVIDGDLAPHRPPGTLPKAHGAAVARAAGGFQLLFWRRGRRHVQEPPRPRLRHRLLYRAQAVMQQWDAAAVFVWLGIPLAQILLGVFPAHVNRWLGIAALVYYAILTPFLFQGYRSANRAALWHSAIVSHALAPQLLAAAMCALLWGRQDAGAVGIARRAAAEARRRSRENRKAASRAANLRERQRKQEAEVAAAEHRKPATWRSAFPKRLTRDFRALRDAGAAETGHWEGVESPRAVSDETAPAAAGNNPATEVPDAGDFLQPAQPQAQQAEAFALPPRPRKPGPLTYVPWFAAAVFAVSGAAAGMGTWLLFSRGDASLHMLAANLPLVVSVLWAAAHCLTASMDLWFALGLRRGALGAVATATEAMCWLLGLTAAVAAIGLGGGEVSTDGQLIRNGFVQAKGAHIEGTPAA